MALFGKILDKIFHHPAAQQQAQPQPELAAAGAQQEQAQQPAPAQTQQVDVGAVLSAMAAAKGGGGNYQSSIVDLLKLLDLDSSLAARKELAEELNVHAGEHGSAEQNVALSKAVWKKLAENGGQVPASLRD